MRDVLDELVELLTLEPIEENLFRGQSQDLGWGAVFGGQVLGQALSAAWQTVPEDRQCHSLHSYFLRRGDARKPIVFQVDRIRDGQSFTTRRVVAIQNGKAIFNLAASFQASEQGLEHEVGMPQAGDPDSLLSEQELARRIADKLPPKMAERATVQRPIDLRVENPIDPFDPPKVAPERKVWLRASKALPDDPRLHHYLLAYASDFHFMVTALQPHGVSWLTPGMQIASLDHAMYFHRPFRMDEWLLHSIESPSAQGARGLVLGRIFDQQGRLVASTVQEGLMRDRRK